MGDRTARKRKHSEDKTPKQKQLARRQNLLVMRPVRKQKWEYEDDERTKVTIFFPRFRSKFGKRFGKFYGFKMHRRLHLDEYGTSVWKLCDGTATVKDIGEVLSEQYGDKVEPLIPRLSEFLRIMERNDFISFKELKSVKKRKT